MRHVSEQKHTLLGKPFKKNSILHLPNSSTSFIFSMMKSRFDLKVTTNLEIKDLRQTQLELCNVLTIMSYLILNLVSSNNML